MLKRYAILIFAAVVVFGVGLLTGQGQNKYGTPSTILHVVTVQWKADSTTEQQTAAIDGVKTMAAAIPGIKNIWIKKLKVQPANYSTVFVMEFENKAAFDRYTDAPAHRAWEKIYLPIHEVSTTHDVTN
jgi:Stress responsive A/B Barrel Domain